jgi:hypothetical protein
VARRALAGGVGVAAAAGSRRSRALGPVGLSQLTSPVRAQRAAREHELGGGRRA